MSLKKPVLDFDAPLQNVQSTTVWKVLALPEGGAVVAYKLNDQWKVIRVDQSKKNIQPYHTCQNNSDIKGLIEDKGFIYILQKNGTITKCDMKDIRESKDIYKIEDVGELRGCVLATSNDFIITDFKKGEIFSYNMKTNMKKVLKSGLNCPTSVAYAEQGDNQLFVVSEWGVDHVTLYDSSWNKMSTIGGASGSKLNMCSCVTFSPVGTLFIAEYGNSRVSEFKTDGTFIRHIVSQQDGIGRPSSISCSVNTCG